MKFHDHIPRGKRKLENVTNLNSHKSHRMPNDGLVNKLQKA